jgi:putative endonuclease
MKSQRQAVGHLGETLAANFLAELGYKILERNVRTPYGEIDLIAEQPSEVDADTESRKTIVFVEVKTRTTYTYGFPETSITPRKIEHMVSAAEYYLQNHSDIELDWRIDVISIEYITTNQEPQIIHFQNAIHN